MKRRATLGRAPFFIATMRRIIIATFRKELAMNFKTIVRATVLTFAVFATFSGAVFAAPASARASQKVAIKTATKKVIAPQRVAFRFSVRPEKIAGYRAWHRRVSPQLLRDLKNAGVSNYSIFLAPDGQAFGYFEVKNYKT